MRKTTLLFNLLSFFSILCYGQVPLPIITGDTDVCHGDSATLMATGVPNATLEWRTAPWPDGTIILPNSPVYTTPGLLDSAYYYVEQRDPVSGSWSQAAEFLVLAHPYPSSVTASNDTLIYGTSVTLSASGADTYTWSPGGLSGQSVLVSPDTTTTFTVTGSQSPAACSDTDDVTITVLLAVPSILGDRYSCNGNSTQLVAIGAPGASFIWYDALIGGTILATTDTLNTGSLSLSTSFYVEQTKGGLTSDRAEAIVNISPIPSPLSPINVTATPGITCKTSSSDLTADVDSANHQIIHWYDAPTGGNLLAATTTGVPYTVSPDLTTTYYAQSEVAVIKTNFDYTGNVQTFTVPAGIYELQIDAYGARGGPISGRNTSLGGRVQTKLTVTPGQELNIYVGGEGGNYLGGWNGGATSGSNSSLYTSGGGATDIRIGGNSLNDRVVVAGGGGGLGKNEIFAHVEGPGHGGGLVGGNGDYSEYGANWELKRGKGGTQTAGGRRGCSFGNSDCGKVGSFGQGGAPGFVSGSGNVYHGGGGGGGWYGGGGGMYDGSGGGGSSYTNPILCSNITHNQGVRNGPGSLVITYSEHTNCADPIREAVTVQVIPCPPSVSGEISICEGSTTQLIASGDAGATFTWYDAPTGGNILSPIDTLQTTNLSSITHFYVEQTAGGLTSDRADITVFVTPIPDPPFPVNVQSIVDSICIGESTGLTANVDTAGNQLVYWYDAATGGNLLGISASQDTFSVSPTTTTTYYAQSKISVSQSIFNYTGGLQTFTVPDGITEISVDAYGARGGNSLHTTGGRALGGRVQAMMEVIPGQVLNIYVGGEGASYTGSNANPPGGYNGGGKGQTNYDQTHGAGAGGGATDIRINGTTTADRVLVAGAGGGRAWGACSGTSVDALPHGGGLTGASGYYCTSSSQELQRGHGGSQTAGGRAGCGHSSNYCATAGSFGKGGNPTDSGGAFIGGGGGSGWYGGGGAYGSGDGGGGSSYTDPVLCSSVSHTQGYQNGHGMLTITYNLLDRNCADETRVPVTLVVDTIPIVVASDDIENCQGVGVTLSASGAKSYNWEPGSLSGASIIVNPTATTTYTVTGTNSICTTTGEDVVVVTVPKVVAPADVDICIGDTTTLTASNADTYTWEPGALSGPSIEISPNDTTLYLLTGHELSGCTSIDSVWVNVKPLPVLTTSNDTLIGMGSLLSLSASGADTYLWSPGGAGSTISFNALGDTTYTVIGNPATGCSDTAEVLVTVVELPDIMGVTTLLVNESTLFSASGPVGSSFAWYDAPFGGNLLGTGESYATSSMMQNTVLYVSLFDGTNNSPRVPIHITAVDSTITSAVAAEPTICPSGSTDLGGTLNSLGMINWYDAPTGGNFLGSSEQGQGFSVSPISTQTYYAEGETERKTETFDYTGSVQTFTVPIGVTSIEIDAYGARGGDSHGGTSGPGKGGQVHATMNVTPGQILNIYVGGQGEDYTSGIQGGWNGGGNGTDSGDGAGGGGATDIRINGTSLNDRILVAGGGGGRAPNIMCTPGEINPPHGGGLVGANGYYCIDGSLEAKRGLGGSQTEGGRAGCWYNETSCADSGTFGNGGDAGFVGADGRAGGGGGGWFGGGGGTYNSDGGGGSSYTNGSLLQNIVHTQGVQDGHGVLRITYSKSSTTNTRSSVILTVEDVTNPVPDVANLSNVDGNAPLTVSTIPTATDHCVGTLNASTTDPLTYNTAGTYQIQWDYDDGNGNVFSQNQTIVVGAVLPVELSDFSAHCEGQQVKLNWRTASEINSSHFEVQHSKDGIRWEALGTVESMGDSEVRNDYQFTAESRFGFELYRLKQIDYNGNSDFSKIINASCAEDNSQIKIYPNPTDNNFTVSYTGDAEEELKLILIDNLGQRLEERSLKLSNGFGKTSFDLSRYPAGFYKLQVSSLGRLRSYRVIKIQK